jgi:KDO2-lipid IV(A) lauroyltransferase
VVRINLKLSFPDKNATDRRQIERLYYRHFCDLIVEGIKNFSISKQEVESRFFI